MLTPQQISQANATAKTGAGYVPPTQAMTPEQAKAWIGSTPQKTDPLASVHIGGSAAVNPIDAIKQQVGAGVDQIKQAYNDTQKGGQNPIIGGIEAGLKGESGLASIITSPLAPIMHPVSKVIGDIGNKVGDISAVQKFAMSPAGEATSRVAEDLSNAGNVAGTILGADQVVKATPRAVSAVKDTATNVAGTVKDVLTTTPEQVAAKAKSSALKASAAIEKEIRNTAEKYPTVGDTLNKAEVSKGTDPIKVISSYPEGKALPTMSKGGKMQSIPAINFLKTQISKLGEIKSNLVGTAKETTSLEDFKQAAFDRIDKGNGSLAKKGADKADVEKIIDGLKATYPDGIPATELDKIKTEQAKESSAYNSKSPFAPDAHAIVGQTAADAVISKGGEAPIDELNKLLASHYDAIKVLKAMNGKTPHGGMFSRHMGGIAGEVAGLAGGLAVGHPFIGAMVGRGASEFVNNVLSSHFISNPLKAALIKGMKGEDPAIIQQALDYIKSTETTGETPVESTPQSSPVKQ